MITLETIDKIKRSINENNTFSHYTRFDSALAILLTSKLKYSDPLQLNDINESSKVVVSKPDDTKDSKSIISQFRQISLTSNGQRKCYDIPAMWAHYAEKGQGVCLLFDKKVLKNIINDTTAKGHRVKYQKTPSRLIDLSSSEDVEEKIKRDYKALFFTKTSDWAYEQEYRIIKRFGINCCDANPVQDSSLFFTHDSLLAVILQGASFKVFSSWRYCLLKRIVDVPILVYDSVFLEERYDLMWMDDNYQTHQLFNTITQC